MPLAHRRCALSVLDLSSLNPGGTPDGRETCPLKGGSLGFPFHPTGRTKLCREATYVCCATERDFSSLPCPNFRQLQYSPESVLGVEIGQRGFPRERPSSHAAVPRDSPDRTSSDLSLAP